MAYTRVAVFLKWSGDAQKRAFKVLQQNYGGAREAKPASYRRSLSTGALLTAYGPKKPRIWIGTIHGESAPSGTANDGTEDINYGTITNLKQAWQATDLKVKSFEDSDYWSCEWKGDWDTALDYDPIRKHATIRMTLEEK